MATKKSRKITLAVAQIFTFLSVITVLAGCILVVVGLLGVSSLSNIDANSFLHEPTIYFNELRSVVGESVVEIVVGAGIVVLGAVVFTVSILRYLSEKNEGKRLSLLEKRIEKLEKSQN